MTIPPTARLAPVRHVRRDGARRAHGRLLHRREPGPVGGRPEARDAPARGPRPPRRPGPLPDEDRGARRRRAAGRAAWAESRGHGHELRAARPARPQGRRAAGRSARRPRDHLRARQPDGRRLGRGGRRAGLERGPHAVAGPRRDELRRLEELRAASSGRATTRPTRASCSCTRGSGRTRCRATGCRSCRSTTTRRSTSSTRLPDPADDRAPARLVQHRRPDGRLHLAAAARRDARHQPGGRRRYGLADGERVRVVSRRGQVEVPVRVDESCGPGSRS